jgi:peptide-methionine (R)-S-oxide reductase
VQQEANSRKPELTCSRCGGHLGHLFKSSRYPGPKHVRHCVNSASLVFTPADAAGSSGLPLAAERR